MQDNPLHDLEGAGQSIWLDQISRRLICSGTLEHLINDDLVSGVTANPTILENAIAETQDYDEDIRRLAADGKTAAEIYEALAIDTVGEAADLLRPTFDHDGEADGFVSIEVSPALAHDTAGSISEARRFWQELNRPNIMIKIPATAEGIPAIEQLTADGINVNVTLIFGVQMYERVMAAYVRGLERRVEGQEPIHQLDSVASFFVSRVDTLVDKLLDEKLEKAEGTDRQRLQALHGKAAVANAKIAYQHFRDRLADPRFQRLTVQGAQPQRPLWASTGTKNPSYSDTLYVSTLVGPMTVSTMTLETIEAFRDHGVVDPEAVCRDLDEAHRVMQELSDAGIDMRQVTDQLIVEGVEKFCTSLNHLLQVIEQRMGALTPA